MGKLPQHLARLAYSAGMFSWVSDPRFWLGRGRRVPIDRPIFLLGLQGGGLTLLTRMLRRQGQVVTGAGGKEWWSGPDEIQNIYGPVLPADLAGTRWKVPPDPLFGPLRSWSFGTDALYPKYRRTEADITPETRAALIRVIRYALARHGRGRAAPRFLDKSQTYMLRVGLIHAALKDSDPRFVLVPRDPYVSVWRAASGKARDMHDILERTTPTERLEYCAQHYAHCMRAVLDDAARLNLPLHILPFEKLLTDPEAELRRLCAALELEFSSDMVPAETHSMPFASRFRDRWYPLKAEVNDGYFSHLTPEAFGIVNAACADIVPRLGYPVRHAPEDTCSGS